MSFEKDLRELMRRPEPPAGFAERVVARLDGESRRETAATAGSSRRWVLRSVAAALIVTVGIGVLGYRAERRRQGESAAEQALVALRLTSEKMNVARSAIQERTAE